MVSRNGTDTSPAPGGHPVTGEGREPATEPAAATAATQAQPPLDPDTFGGLEPATPPLTGEGGALRLSFSRVDTYQNCPRKFRYAYLDRLPREPSPHLSFGSSLHGALESFYDRKLPVCPSEDELLGFLYDAWEPSGFREFSRDEQLDWYRHAQEVLRRFHRRVAPSYQLPVATEAWFELPLEDAVVVGSIDRVDRDEAGELHVVDYKTNRRVKDRGQVARSLQLAIYALACEHLYGELPATVSLDFVVAGLEVRVPLGDLDLVRARRAVTDTAARIRDGAFDPTPNRLCGWCDFRRVCPAWDGEGPEVLGEAVATLERLRSRLRREVRELRELEDGVARLRTELAGE